MATDLVTLTQFKYALSRDPADTSQDPKLQQALDNASQAILTFCERDFDTAEVTETRTYSYRSEDNGWLEIDDCHFGSITALTINGSAPDSTQWSAGPERRSPVHYWLRLPPFVSMNPAMGFTYNLDVLYLKFLTAPQQVAVTATWGWPVVPADVQQAAVYVASAFAESPTPYVSRHFEGYSTQLPTPLLNAIPDRAKELLYPYQRLKV